MSISNIKCFILDGAGYRDSSCEAVAVEAPVIFQKLLIKLPMPTCLSR